MLSSDYTDTVRMGGYEASSSNEVDAAAAASSSPPTSRCVSPYPPPARTPAKAAATVLNGVATHLAGVPRSGEGHSSSSHTRHTSPWIDRHSASSSSLDADDEADAQSPSDTATQVAAASFSATETLEYGAWQGAEASGDAGTDTPSLNSAAANATAVAETTAASASCNGVRRSSAAAGLPPLARHRVVKRSTPPAEVGGSDTSSSNSPAVPFPSKAASSAAAAVNGTGSADVATRPRTLSGAAAAAAAARVVTPPLSQAAGLDALPEDDTDDAKGRSAAASSPAHQPSSLPSSSAASATRTLSALEPLSADAAGAAAVALLPLGSRLRLPSASATELQEYGCCVFFFPAAFVSWLFPFVGHVAISNAEGSRLYTFESSYYVREEKLVAVLDRVLRAEAQEPRTASVLRNASQLGIPSNAGAALDVASPLRSPSSSPRLRRSVMSDGSGSDATATSPSDTSAASPFRHGVTTPVFPSRSSTRPLRRPGRSRTAGAGATSGHAHTPCVRVWDLKPLLMESRGRRTRRTPYGFTTQGGKQAAAALWERLQGLLQPTDLAPPPASASAGSSGATGAAPAPRSPVLAMKRRSTSDYHSDDADGATATVAAGMSSSSNNSSGAEEEEDAYELLDAETARFYNRNLHATIRLFRGSADGSINSPDVVLQHHSSFSFVGFVLEACGIGSQGRPNPATAAAATATAAAAPASTSPPTMPLNKCTGVAPAAAAVSGGPPPATSTEPTESEEEIHWGVAKLLFHVFVFGKWQRGERRLWRATHGGSISSATILWIAILSITIYYLHFLFTAYATKDV